MIRRFDKLILILLTEPSTIVMKNNSPFSPIVHLVIYSMMFITSCSLDTKKPNVSEITVDLTVNRFENDLFEMDIMHPDMSISTLKQKYGDFFDLYMFQITSLGVQDSILMRDRIMSFVQDTNFRAVYRDCKKEFGDFAVETKALKNAFQYYKFYFPNKPIPSIVTMLSGFSFPIVCDSFNLGIGLDMYLGKDYRFYSTLEPPLPNYLKVQMVKSNVVCDAMKGWAMSDYQIDESKAQVIDMMISQGRIISFLEKVLPDAKDTMRLGYTSSQLEWCEQSEKKIWQFFVQNKLLFSVDPTILSKYTNEGPTTNGFPKESPGNIGKYIGWKIIKSYEKKHPEVSIEKLMEEKDLMKIYNESGYRAE